MGKPHKHAEVIKAWADGAEVQYKHKDGDEWCLYKYGSGAGFNHQDYVWRIKPELKDPALVLKEAWYKSLLGCDADDGNMREWKAAAKALIQAYKAGELKEI